MADGEHVLSPGLSVVVPVCNSEGTLKTLAARLEPVLRGVGNNFELILVNDASRDDSWGGISGLSQAHAWISGVDLMRNYGQHNAVLCGIRTARFDTIVTIDDDLQNPPEMIPRLLAKLNEGYDVVYGTPEAQRHGLLRDVASSITKVALQMVMGVENARHVSAFRVFRTQLREAFVHFHSPFVSIDVLLTYGARRFTHLPVAHEPRTLGESNYSLLKLVKHAINTVTSFSTLPLRAATFLGFTMTFFGFVILVYVIGRFAITGRSLPGFPFLASMIAIFSGAQLFAIGIMGEYLARIHLRSMDHPPYAVRKATDPWREHQ